MDSLLFTADILKAKLKVLETGHAVTRRLMNPQPNIPVHAHPVAQAELLRDFLKGHKPKFHVGQVVYLKEAWCPLVNPLAAFLDGTMPTVYKQEMDAGGAKLPKEFKWHSPLFMPAWAARHFVKILSVRPERLQSITPEDCRLEGVTKVQCDCGECIDSTEVGAFQDLWDSCSKKYPWSSNPFCFRYEIEKTVRPE